MFSDWISMHMRQMQMMTISEYKLLNSACMNLVKICSDFVIKIFKVQIYLKQCNK